MNLVGFAAVFIGTSKTPNADRLLDLVIFSGHVDIRCYGAKDTLRSFAVPQKRKLGQQMKHPDEPSEYP